jgi:hypothetical protein
LPVIPFPSKRTIFYLEVLKIPEVSTLFVLITDIKKEVLLYLYLTDVVERKRRKRKIDCEESFGRAQQKGKKFLLTTTDTDTNSITRYYYVRRRSNRKRKEKLERKKGCVIVSSTEKKENEKDLGDR